MLENLDRFYIIGLIMNFGSATNIKRDFQWELKW